jgi:hypothetical protein
VAGLAPRARAAPRRGDRAPLVPAQLSACVGPDGGRESRRILLNSLWYSPRIRGRARRRSRSRRRQRTHGSRPVQGCLKAKVVFDVGDETGVRLIELLPDDRRSELEPKWTSYLLRRSYGSSVFIGPQPRDNAELCSDPSNFELRRSTTSTPGYPIIYTTLLPTIATRTSHYGVTLHSPLTTVASRCGGRRYERRIPR